ncbi:MAG: response regulator, partial [Magnetococcales bacterium]|nr:response regulator [Magnetococcales bacterium]
EQDGLAVIREVRRVSPLVKVIGMSGGGRTLSSALSLNVAEKVGADATLPKPFSMEELFQTVDRVLNGRS